MYGLPDPEWLLLRESADVVLGGCCISDESPEWHCKACGHEWGRLLESEDAFGTFTTDDALAYIAKVRWQFAKTMPQWPHEYTIRDWRDDLEDEFVAFAELIRRHGVVKPWPRDARKPRYHHTYLQLGDWEYWTVGAPIPETVVINRAIVETNPLDTGPQRT
ncbi:MAG: hypothetical protein QOF21_39 [Actinomycetota bacterium]|jgi:hypothetical protein